MSYAVEVNRHFVLCQTPAEVHALTTFNGHSSGLAAPRKPRKGRKAKAAKEDRRGEGIRASWEVARRVAKKLNRKDVMQVRSELRQGKLKDE